MSPTKSASESSSRPRKVSAQKPRKPYKQKKIPKSLNGVPVTIYGAKMEDFMDGVATIQPLQVANVVSESSLPHTTSQDTVNLASSHIPVDPVSTRAYHGAEPSHEQYYDPDFNSQVEELLSLTNDPFQSYRDGRYDPSYHFSPPSASGSLEHGLEPYQWDPNAQHFIPQPNILSYVSNAPSFHGNSNNDIYPEFSGSPHLTTSTSNDGTLPFPIYDPNYYM